MLWFTVYVIYTFSAPFGPLFLLWVAVLGLCVYALIGGLTAVDHSAVASRFGSRPAVTVVAWFLIVTAVLSGLLWLSEDVPALPRASLGSSERTPSVSSAAGWSGATACFPIWRRARLRQHAPAHR